MSFLVCLVFFKDSLSLAWSSPRRIGWPTNKPQGCACLHIPSGRWDYTRAPSQLVFTLRHRHRFKDPSNKNDKRQAKPHSIAMPHTELFKRINAKHIEWHTVGVQ